MTLFILFWFVLVIVINSGCSSFGFWWFESLKYYFGCLLEQLYRTKTTHQHIHIKKKPDKVQCAALININAYKKKHIQKKTRHGAMRSHYSSSLFTEEEKKNRKKKTDVKRAALTQVQNKNELEQS